MSRLYSGPTGSPLVGRLNSLTRCYLTSTQHDLVQTIATVRRICEQDAYDIWKAFAPIVIQAVPDIRQACIEYMLQHPESWHDFYCSRNMRQVFRQLVLTLIDVGHKEEGGKSESIPTRILFSHICASNAHQIVALQCGTADFRLQRILVVSTADLQARRLRLFLL